MLWILHQSGFDMVVFEALLKCKLEAIIVWSRVLLLCLIDRCAHVLLVSSTVITVKMHNFTRFTSRTSGTSEWRFTRIIKLPCKYSNCSISVLLETFFTFIEVLVSVLDYTIVFPAWFAFSHHCALNSKWILSLDTCSVDLFSDLFWGLNVQVNTRHEEALALKGMKIFPPVS